jgi:hypothetical protein
MSRLILIFAVLLTACCAPSDNNNTTNFKYQSGDVVYLKPDSLKVTITQRWDFGDKNIKYDVVYYNKIGEQVDNYVYEYEIYGKSY